MVSSSLLKVRELIQQEISFYENYKKESDLFKKSYIENNDEKNLISDYYKFSFQIDNTLTDRKNRLKKINECIMNNCNHEWVDDYIDIDPDTSKPITYCCFCEATI